MSIAVCESKCNDLPQNNDFLERYNKIKTETPDGITKKARSIFEQINSKLGFNSDLKYKVQNSVEHMSTGYLGGALPHKATKKVIALLKKMEPLEGIKDVIKKLEYLHSIHTGLCNPFRIYSSVKRVLTDIAQLEVGQSLLIPSEILCHAMVMHITCTFIDQGNKKFSITNFNEGLGLRYHYEKNEVGKAPMYQVAYNIENVKGEKLDKYIIKVLCLDWDIKKFYKKLIALGDVAPQQSNERIWSYGQMGGSCAFSCLNAYIRSQLHPEIYEKYQLLAKKENLLKIYRQIRKGCGKNSLKIQVALEIINDLEANNSQRNFSDIKKELQDIKKSTKQNIECKINLPVYPSAKVNYLQHLKQIYYIIKNNSLDTELIKIIINEYFSPFNKKLNNTLEFEKFIKIYTNLMKHFANKPLNANQTYLVTGLFCIFDVILNENTSFNNERLSKKIYKIQCFNLKFLKKCKILKLADKVDISFSASYFHEILKSVINA